MSIVNTDVPITSASCSRMIRKIVEQYPFCRSEIVSRTAFQRPLRTLVIGSGPRKVFFTAAHHANEWITSLVLLKYVEDVAHAYATGDSISGYNPSDFLQRVTIYTLPMVNPDGVDLVNGAIDKEDPQYAVARALSVDYPSVPFPGGWKANLLGTDLNLNYPAGWDKAREIKFSQGYTSPGPRDYVGRAPLNQLESQALAEFTEYLAPDLVLCYHTQGRVIYWKYDGYDVPGAEQLGKRFADVSGYTLAQVPYDSGFAGFKDWFIQQYRKPGYTIEVGRGKNPIPLSQFDEIYGENVGILSLAALGQ